MTIVEKLAIDILIVYWLLKGLALTNSNINVGNDADFFVSEISNLDVELRKRSRAGNHCNSTIDNWI